MAIYGECWKKMNSSGKPVRCIDGATRRSFKKGADQSPVAPAHTKSQIHYFRYLQLQTMLTNDYAFVPYTSSIVYNTTRISRYGIILCERNISHSRLMFFSANVLRS